MHLHDLTIGEIKLYKVFAAMALVVGLLAMLAAPDSPQLPLATSFVTIVGIGGLVVGSMLLSFALLVEDEVWLTANTDPFRLYNRFYWLGITAAVLLVGGFIWHVAAGTSHMSWFWPALAFSIGLGVACAFTCWCRQLVYLSETVHQ